MKVLSLPGRILDWAFNPDTPGWKIAAAGLGSLCLVAGIIAAIFILTHASAGCPAGQQLTVIQWIPIQSGSTTIMSPIYGCTAA